jgi:hypothetical protein
MEGGQHQASAPLSPFLSISAQQLVEDMTLGDVALGASSVQKQTTTKPVNAFPDAANNPARWRAPGKLTAGEGPQLQGSATVRSP